MLQQTQVDRVIPKYKEFLKKFPTVKKLAEAQLPEVLQLWSGLGYNRRARMLHEAAKRIMDTYKGHFPKSTAELEMLPGVGPYTARAVATFAYNQPTIMIETNIRSVFLHEFFKNHDNVPDSELLILIRESVEHKECENPREWYAALMDYGTYLKKAHINPSRKSKHHTRQPKFRGSLRKVRGQILPLLFSGAKTEAALVKTIREPKEQIHQALAGLTKDGLIEKRGKNWSVAT
jgi:A/G-specific adenine glycosylase